MKRRDLESGLVVDHSSFREAWFTDYHDGCVLQGKLSRDSSQLQAMRKGQVTGRAVCNSYYYGRRRDAGGQEGYNVVRLNPADQSLPFAAVGSKTASRCSHADQDRLLITCLSLGIGK